jgi:hypothetical protein
MMLPTLSSEKKSAGDVVPAATRVNPSIASWLPCMAPKQLLKLFWGRFEGREHRRELEREKDLLVARRLVKGGTSVRPSCVATAAVVTD